ncbi:hypothetical protein EKG37_17435 [Robertmurraya yapensis]|uniref:Uncharacterized protein n=1 Tax=Bacillus yapensis TaxID=2492960 RepID=A0A431VYC2_9BACI|nr:hypothetical protein [Bacillus yapensis]RTR28086.1 hypothetical protein EKG37_17435 [Bacillus yapensis]TKS94328.1 hypothetical protein FAR12_17435 [Bacillus yapensis]
MRKKEFLNQLLAADAIIFVKMIIFALIHFIPPSEAAGIGLSLSHLATGGAIITAVIFVLVNIGWFIYYLYKMASIER